jgi:hypothetical protein
LIAAGFLVAGVTAIVAAVVLTQNGGDDTDNVAVATMQAPIPSANGLAFEPTEEAGQAIVALARRSIEVLPQGQWPSLYDDFVASFEARCSAAEFAQAGVDSAANLGEDLQLLGYKYMQDVTVAGDTATGTIVGEVRGKSEYQVSAAFARENGVWKIAPVPDTAGCAAFTVIS